MAPGYQALNFEPPEPGSYSLPIIKAAPDGSVTTHQGESTSISRLLENRVGILSFIYTSCDDVNGCPLASFVLSKIDKRIQKDANLRNSVRLLSLSFDQETDTTETLAAYAKGFTTPDSSWAFLRATSKQELSSILKDYDQSIVIEPDGSTISHILRVYLIDLQGNIRNVYSVSFLHADTIVSDIETVLQQTNTKAEVGLPGHPVAPENVAEFGDYPTQSTALKYNNNNGIDLAIFNQKPQLGLPPVAADSDVKDVRKVNLGKKLFFDRRLSHNDTISCAMCHIPEQGFTSNELSTAVGIEGRTVRRNSPTLLNVGYLNQLFHDSRESKLEHQVWSPLLAHNEMANPSIGIVLEKLTAIEEYRAAFEELYTDGLSMYTLGAAIAAYEQSLNAGDSPVDQLLYGQKNTSDDPQLQEGLELFRGKAGCSSCHTIGQDSALFTDQKLHNTGIGYLRSMGGNNIFKDVLVAPGQSLEVHQDDVGPNELDELNDLGRYEITEVPADRWKYRTPSLRNVALTSPYMHNGSLAKLRDVVEFYNAGGIENPELDPLITPLGLSDLDITNLVYFLEQLTSPHVELLVKDARSTPIGERQ